MGKPAFHPGFRFSLLDAAVLLVGLAATVGFAWVDLWVGLSIAFVVLHFFLFCNVIRMSRLLELIWAAIFVVLAVLATAGWVGWPVVFALSLLATVVVAVVELRRPSYHGVGWKIIRNPACE